MFRDQNNIVIKRDLNKIPHYKRVSRLSDINDCHERLMYASLAHIKKERTRL